MSFWGDDPGECIVCGAAHCGCTGDGGGGPLMLEQLPATADAAARAAAVSTKAAPLQADIIQAALPPGQFTTGTYRRTKTRERTTTTPG